MGDHGGLPAIDPYIIERGWWLKQIRHLHSIRRVHGIKVNNLDRRLFQRQLCKIRSEKYGKQ